MSHWTHGRVQGGLPHPFKCFQEIQHNDLSHSHLVLDFETGRRVTNYQLLKELSQPCIMKDTEHLMIAGKNKYRVSQDYAKVISFQHALRFRLSPAFRSDSNRNGLVEIVC